MSFRLITPFQLIQRRSFSYGTPAELLGTNANPLVNGEWLELANNGLAMDRGAVNPAVVPSWPVFAETGRSDVRMLDQVPMLYGGFFEAETQVMTATGITLGEGLEVADVTFGSLTRRGLVQSTTGLVIGYATRLPANNGGWLRFVRTL